MKACQRGSDFASANLLGPYCSIRLVASAAERPWAGSTPSARATSGPASTCHGCSSTADPSSVRGASIVTISATFAGSSCGLYGLTRSSLGPDGFSDVLGRVGGEQSLLVLESREHEVDEDGPEQHGDDSSRVSPLVALEERGLGRRDDLVLNRRRVALRGIRSTRKRLRELGLNG